MLEMAFNWGYWENYNNLGVPCKPYMHIRNIRRYNKYRSDETHQFCILASFLLCLVVVLNAGRNSISFFMLLIVCMGYGVVK